MCVCVFASPGHSGRALRLRGSARGSQQHVGPLKVGQSAAASQSLSASVSITHTEHICSSSGLALHLSPAQLLSTIMRGNILLFSIFPLLHSCSCQRAAFCLLRCLFCISDIHPNFIKTSYLVYWNIICHLPSWHSSVCEFLLSLTRVWLRWDDTFRNEKCIAGLINPQRQEMTRLQPSV